MIYSKICTFAKRGGGDDEKSMRHVFNHSDHGIQEKAEH